MFQSKAPFNFWGECILIVAYLINKTPMVLLSNNTLFATLFKKEANYNIIKTFRCLAHASTPSVNRFRFDPIAQSCVFMGFPPDVEGYKLYDIAKRKFFISRDILFFEELYPFHSIKEKDIPISHGFLERFVIPYPLFNYPKKETIINLFTNARPMTEDTLEESHGVDDQNPYISNSKETSNTNQAPIPTMTRKFSRPYHPT